MSNPANRRMDTGTRGGGLGNDARRARQGRGVVGVVLGLLLVVALPPNPARAQTTGGSAVSATSQALQQQYPGVQFYESGGRIRAIYGVPMAVGTTGATAQGVAQAWLAQFGAVFGEPSLAAEHYSFVQTRSDKTVVSFTQKMDGVRIEGSLLTIVLSGVPIPRVVGVSARVALRPPGGLPNALITAQQAQQAAQAHPQGLTLDRWSIPYQTAIYDDAPIGDARACRVFCLVGSSSSIAPISFYVDAVSGSVVRWHSNLVSFDVTGTVTGKGSGTNRLAPDTWGTPQAPPPGTGTLACPNPTVSLGGLARTRVSAFLPGTSQVVASVFTRLDGTYTIPIAVPGLVDVKAELIGPYWTVRDGTNPGTGNPFCCNVPSCCNEPCCLTPCDCFAPAAPEPFPGNPVSTSATGVNLELNTTYTEFRTAHVNAAAHLERTNSYFQNRLCQVCDVVVPGLHEMVDVIVNYSHNPTGNNAYAFPAFRTLWFGKFFPSLAPENEHANFAYSTVIAHEYGHYLIYWMRQIPVGVAQHTAFHEGYGDTLALLVNEATDYGIQQSNSHPTYSTGCAHVSRQPLSYGFLYPDCANTAPHTHGQLLSHVWLNILANLRGPYGYTAGLEVTRQLHVDWSLLTNGGEAFAVSCSGINTGRSVHPQTAIEVLLADDNDGNLSNGTPHHCLICGAFGDRGIPCPTILPPCPDGPVPGGNKADCDRDGAVTPADAVCFQHRFMARAVGADLDANAVINAEDWRVFLRAYDGARAATASPVLWPVREGDR